MPPQTGSRKDSRTIRGRSEPRAAFTLVELMVVVTILGILATISIPMYSKYVYRSKTSEAVGFLAEIKSRQESYRSDFGSYCDVSVNAEDWYPGPDPGDEAQDWPAGSAWDILGAQPPGRRAVFSYVTVADNPGTDPTDRDFDTALGYDGSDFWFVSRALGDLDGDDVNVTFESYSHSQTTWVSNGEGWE